jgi:hypothetical protein
MFEDRACVTGLAGRCGGGLRERLSVSDDLPMLPMYLPIWQTACSSSGIAPPSHNLPWGWLSVSRPKLHAP